VDRSASFPFGAEATLAELSGPDPHRLLDRLREREPVSWLPALDGWLVTRRDLAGKRVVDVDQGRNDAAHLIGRQVADAGQISNLEDRRLFG